VSPEGKKVHTKARARRARGLAFSFLSWGGKRLRPPPRGGVREAAYLDMFIFVFECTGFGMLIYSLTTPFLIRLPLVRRL
jgi:hypothetical protein